VARRRHHRQSGLGQPVLQDRRALLMTLAFDSAFLQMADAGERAGGERGATMPYPFAPPV